MKRQQKREDGSRQENFAALQLLHDPQVGRGGALGLGWGATGLGCCWQRARPPPRCRESATARPVPRLGPLLPTIPGMHCSLASMAHPTPHRPTPLPQGFAEKLFKRLQKGHERFEARMAVLNVVSRCVGVHKLLLLNFYPFLQVPSHSLGVGVGHGCGVAGPGPGAVCGGLCVVDALLLRV